MSHADEKGTDFASGLERNPAGARTRHRWLTQLLSFKNPLRSVNSCSTKGVPVVTREEVMRPDMREVSLLRERGGCAHIQVDEVGITVRQGRLVVALQWSEIQEIRGRKFDAWVVDTICIDIIASRGTLTLTEDDGGYRDLLVELVRRFHVSEQAMDEIAAGPFGEEDRRLWP